MTHSPPPAASRRTRRLIPVLGDQLSRGLSSLREIGPDDVVLMMEVAAEATHVRHHKQKIALILAAMRHFAEDLRAAGLRVDYITLDDPANSGSFTGELARAVARHRPDRIVITEPGEWRVLKMIRGWDEDFGLPVDIREDDRFLCSRAGFARWAAGRRQFRMEYFYRDMRRQTGILMDGDQPLGGQWNFDAENRKALPPGHRPSDRLRFPPDDLTQGVIDLVGRRFPDHFGTLEAFNWPVTRAGALTALTDFIARSLPRFGDYQDAMKQGAPFLDHSLLAPALNLGLLDPREVCAAAEAACRAGKVPLNAAEGFIRQIIGWREYVRGLYWLKMPAYGQSNALDATRPLPWFYWSGETAMNCVANVVRDTAKHAYAHHIQRLMVTGNFALLAGLAPAEVEAWYLSVYADAFDWVELPNTHGMALFADGGLLASKPYAASGAYIDRMSDYCGHCAFDVKAKAGPRACPFNYLYWDFLLRHEARLKGNPRLAMPYRSLAAMTAERRAAIREDAARFLAQITT